MLDTRLNTKRKKKWFQDQTKCGKEQSGQGRCFSGWSHLSFLGRSSLSIQAHFFLMQFFGECQSDKKYITVILLPKLSSADPDWDQIPQLMLSFFFGIQCSFFQVLCSGNVSCISHQQGVILCQQITSTSTHQLQVFFYHKKLFCSEGLVGSDQPAACL